MGVEKNSTIPAPNYFNRPLSHAKELEVANAPDCFGRSTPTPIEIKKAISAQTTNKPISRKSLVYYVDENGIRPYREIDFTPTKRSREDRMDDKYSGFKSRRRQSRSYRNNSNSKTS